MDHNFDNYPHAHVGGHMGLQVVQLTSDGCSGSGRVSSSFAL